MGSPDFASPSLKKIIESRSHEVVAVFTSKPKPKNRGMKVSKSPIHMIADEHNIEVHTPSTLRDGETLRLIDDIEADIIIVVAYGFIVPEEILNLKKHGAINLHPSKLPRFRGAAPLQHTIISGDTETSICVIQMDKGLDTGDILAEEDYKLHPRITLEELANDTAQIGAKLIVEVLDNIENIQPRKQSSAEAAYASKLSKEDGRINWNKSAAEIDCMIRGMNPWPGTYFTFQNMLVKVLEAEATKKIISEQPGKIVENPIEVACGSNSIIIKKLQIPGKKPISAEEFSKGYRINLGNILE